MKSKKKLCPDLDRKSDQVPEEDDSALPFDFSPEIFSEFQPTVPRERNWEVIGMAVELTSSSNRHSGRKIVHPT